MTRSSRRVAVPFVVAACLGLVHAATSLYWGAGGAWLLPTLGERLTRSLVGARWVLVPVSAVKAAVAVGPLLLAGDPDRVFGPLRTSVRAIAWTAATVLVLWGGVNTAVGNLVLTEVIRPDGGYDRPGMIGHAWLWDPLFLAWGVALAVGLLRTGRPRADSPRRPA